MTILWIAAGNYNLQKFFQIREIVGNSLPKFSYPFSKESVPSKIY